MKRKQRDLIIGVEIALRIADGGECNSHTGEMQRQKL